MRRVILSTWAASRHKRHLWSNLFYCSNLSRKAAARESSPSLSKPRASFGNTETQRFRVSKEDLKAELERLRKENAALRKEFASGIRLKVSEKGAVSVYGLRRFPVTLYKYFPI